LTRPVAMQVSGMRNRESNCYLTAFLQCLAATASIMLPSFRRGKLPPNSLTAMIQHSLFDLVVPLDRSVDPTPLLDRICRLSGAEKAKCVSPYLCPLLCFPFLLSQCLSSAPCPLAVTPSCRHAGLACECLWAGALCTMVVIQGLCQANCVHLIAVSSQ
jgi:hypothetical protein